MTQPEHSLARLRTRWSAIGAAVAITLGAGGIGLAQAAVDSGDKPITVTVDSKRILDTRINLGLAGGFAKDTPREVQVTGPVTVATATGTATETVVPAGATAALVNVTVVFPTDQGFLTLRAGGASGAPSTSTVNFQAGTVEPNAATVDLSADGKVQVWVFMPDAAAKADVLIDVVGYTVDHNHDDRYYTEDEVDTAVAPKANSADVYTVSEVDAALGGLAPFVRSATLANDAFVRMAGSAFSVEDHCADPEGCQITVIREYDGTRYLYGPITFYEVEGGAFWTHDNGAAGSTSIGTSADGPTTMILGTSACNFSDWDSSGNSGNGDQNGNFGVIHFNNTATVQTCTVRIED